MAESARVIIEVQAGIIPEQPEPEFTKRWVITSEEWEDGQSDVLLSTRYGQAQGYAAMLALHPERFNWVRVDWLYL
jgi:hypothetical protein